VFENRVLRRIFGPKRDEVTGEWRKLHNEELHNLYSSPDIIRQVKSRGMRWAGHVARMGEERKVYKVLVGKPEGKRPLGRPRRRWEHGIRMDLRLGVCGLDSTGSGQGQVAGCCECGDESSGSCATELVRRVVCMGDSKILGYSIIGDFQSCCLAVQEERSLKALRRIILMFDKNCKCLY
jgi:hypothetical protein